MHSKMLLVVLALSSWCALSEAHGSALPAGLHRCTYPDEACLTEAVNYAIRTHAKQGIKELDLVSLDPLRIKKMSLKKNANSPVSIDLSFSDVHLLGLSQAQVKSVTGFNKELNKPIVLDMLVPRIAFQGPYSVEGKVLILPIVGKGDAEIVLEKAHCRAKLKLKPVHKSDGKTYAEVTHMYLELIPGHVTYKLGGLFSGQAQLSDDMHRLINENWQDIFNELKGDIGEALSLIIKSVLNNIFTRHPMEWLFSDA